jgi:hypothetical protein
MSFASTVRSLAFALLLIITAFASAPRPADPALAGIVAADLF